MYDLKSLRNRIKNYYSQESVSEILIILGYEIDSNFKLKLRNERTASASVSSSGYITDFGGDFSGDIISLLFEYKNIPLSTATVYIAKAYNINLKEFLL